METVVANHPHHVHEAALISALGWLQPRVVYPIVQDWLGYDGPRWRALALAAHVAHRLDPRTAIDRGLLDGDPRVQLQAVRACGVFGRRSLVPTLRGLHDVATAPLRFAVARSLLQLHQRDAPDLLWECALEGGERAETAAELALREMSRGEARRRLDVAVRRPSLARVALVGAAATGDPAFAELLLDAVEDVELGGIAASGLHAMFGLEQESRGVAIAGGRDWGTDPPVPDAEHVRGRWTRVRDRFDTGQRWLLGRPRGPEAMRCALRCAPQRLRALVAHDLHRWRGGQSVPFEVDAPEWRQIRRLAMRGRRDS